MKQVPFGVQNAVGNGFGNAFNSVVGGPRASHAVRLKKKIPDWTKSKAAMLELLRSVFPKLLTDKRQQKHAARWFDLIQLYYKRGEPTSVVASTMNVRRSWVQGTLRRIRNAAAGKRTDGKPRTGKPGRPKQIRF